MKLHVFSIGAILGICLLNVAHPATVKQTKGSGTLSVSITPTGVGSDATSVKVVLPTNKGNIEKIAADGSKLVNDVIQNMDSAQACLKEVPFLGFSNWQKYHALALKEYVIYKTDYATDKQLEDILHESGVSLGDIHDDVLAQSCDGEDDDKYDPREARMVQLVKAYFRLAMEKYIDIEIDIYEVNAKIEIANQSDKQYFGDKVKYRRMVKKKIAKPDVINIECYYDDDALDSEKALFPDDAAMEYAKRHDIKLKGEKAYAISAETHGYICDSKKIEQEFVVFQTDVEFSRKKGTESKGRKKDKDPPGFSWVQTYVNGERVAILDNYRIKITLSEEDDDRSSKKRRRSSSPSSSTKKKGKETKRRSSSSSRNSRKDPKKKPTRKTRGKTRKSRKRARDESETASETETDETESETESESRTDTD